MKRSRRRFLRLLAAGSAVVLAAPGARVARAAAPAKKGSKRGTTRAAIGAAKPAPAAAPPPAVAEEIRKQQTQVAQTLKILRDYPLPPGSEPAVVFAPIRPRRKERGR